MKARTITVLLGAVVASSFSAPARFGAGGPADAADAISRPPPQAVKVPEFVPVINFSEFVMAMQSFAAENPPAARLAAEALSAKFASNADSKQIELNKGAQAAAQTAKPAPVIVSRPVVVASIPTVPTVSIPDPTEHPPAFADPVKIVTGYSEKPDESAPRRHKAEQKAAATNRGHVEKRFQPAMGLGMVIDSAEDAPPISSLAQKKRISTAGSRDTE